MIIFTEQDIPAFGTLDVTKMTVSLIHKKVCREKALYAYCQKYLNGKFLKNDLIKFRIPLFCTFPHLTSNLPQFLVHPSYTRGPYRSFVLNVCLLTYLYALSY